MERTTRKMCERQVEFLNKELNRPMVSWVKVGDKNIAQVGNFHIESNSPGDGLTRFQLAEIHNVHGGISIVDNRTCLGASEFFTFLRGILEGIRIANLKVEIGDHANHLQDAQRQGNVGTRRQRAHRV